MAILYKRDLAGVDWEALRSTLLEDDFDNGRTPDQLRRSFENSAVTVFALATTPDGERIIGKGRALSDGVCNAYVVDLWTYTPYRRQGIAATMMRLMLHDMPGQHVYLFTDDSPHFYRAIGMQQRGLGFEALVGQWLDNRPLAPDAAPY